MRTTGVLPEALAASISRFSRSETVAMTHSSARVEGVPTVAKEPGRQGSPARDGPPLVRRGALAEHLDGDLRVEVPAAQLDPPAPRLVEREAGPPLAAGALEAAVGVGLGAEVQV